MGLFGEADYLPIKFIRPLAQLDYALGLLEVTLVILVFGSLLTISRSEFAK